MSVKIRLQRHGRKNRPFYHIVAASSRSPRDGAFLELLGHYNPMLELSVVEVNLDALKSWIAKGAQMSNAVKQLLKNVKKIPTSALTAPVLQ